MPGLTDGFGDRLLMFDNTDSDGLEMLRFHRALVAIPGFEEALHERLRQLGQLPHAAFPAIRALKRFESDGSLVLVSTYTPGKRLSAFLAEPRPGAGLHPAFVTWVIRQVIQPLSILQSAGADVSHGALTADRVVLTPDGRVRIVEHVLGSALRHLDRSSAGLWREFGLLAPTDNGGVPRLDARADVFQVGALALSMLLARRLTPEEVEQRLPHLLDQWSSAAKAGSRPFENPLRLWLERALQVGDRPYHSASEAYADLRQLPSAPASRALELLEACDDSGLAIPRVALQSTAQSSGQEAHMANHVSLDGDQVSDSGPLTAPPRMPESGIADRAEALPMELKAAGYEGRLLPFASMESVSAASLPTTAIGNLLAAPKSKRAWSWIAVALTAVALVEAVVIATLFVRQPPESSASTGATVPPIADIPRVEVRQEQAGAPIPPAGLDAGIAQPVSDQSTTSPEAPPDVGRRSDDEVAAALALAASKQRSGGVRLSAPIELKVLQGDRVLGSSIDGPIVTTAGTHQLDLINTSLGFRARQAVTFRAGEITTVTIPVPPGRVSINAEPWAEVWIDNRLVGETPLANVEIPIGEHEIMFRHPELGERRQNVIVRADAVSRVSATFVR
jgi:hypothetical protein